MAPIGIDDDQLEVMRREAEALSLHSEEARRDLESARRRRVVVLVLGGCLLVCWSFFMVWLGRGTRPESDPVEEQDLESGTVNIEPAGSPEAKPQVLCVLPGGSDCHSAVVKLLTAAANKHHAEIRVEFKDMHAIGEEELTKRIGSYCAAIAINDKTSFEVRDGEKRLGIHLIGTAPTHYSLVDVMRALTHEYTALYGDPGEPLVSEEVLVSCSDSPANLEPSGHDHDEDDEKIELPLSGELKLQTE